MATLQFAQEGEQGCDFATGIFVDAVQAHEGIEDEQAWLELGERFFKAAAIGVEIEPHGGSSDHLEIEICEVEARGDADALEPSAHNVEWVFGGVEHDTTGT